MENIFSFKHVGGTMKQHLDMSSKCIKYAQNLGTSISIFHLIDYVHVKKLISHKLLFKINFNINY
jgi:hypothetical protein